MRTHTTRGEEICRHIRTLAPVLPIIRSHHERWDGTGYPDGLRGEETPLLARILQIADVFDALTSVRPISPRSLAPRPSTSSIARPAAAGASRAWSPCCTSSSSPRLTARVAGAGRLAALRSRPAIARNMRQALNA